MGARGARRLLGEARAALAQVLIVFLINVPTVSFGLALGWVSLASGRAGEGAGRAAVVAAVSTFAASVVGVPLSARALRFGRKAALIGTSAAFLVCWSLKLAGAAWGGAGGVGGAWWLVGARVAAGLGGAAAWALSPLLAREMCSERYRGAAVSATPVAHNAGVVLMYLAGDAALPHRAVLWCCAALSLAHCAVFACVPESPPYLAARGDHKEARASLAWYRGLAPRDPALEQELAALPPPQHDQSSWTLAREMLSDVQRRRAFLVGALAVVGQETCGVLAILQYAERIFVLAHGPDLAPLPEGSNATRAWAGEGVSPARHALLLGVVQLLMSVLALYLVERVGRRPLVVWCAALAGGALAAAAALAHHAPGAAAAIAVAVAADAAGLQPAPYALLADMFHYQYRSCALMLVSAGACVGNALEVALLPAVAAAGGLRAALALAAALTLAYALAAAALVPETRGRTPQQIYDIIYPLEKKEKGDSERGTGAVDSTASAGSAASAGCARSAADAVSGGSAVIKDYGINSESKCTSL